jgi:Tfp pilus assembly protein PilN
MRPINLLPGSRRRDRGGRIGPAVVVLSLLIYSGLLALGVLWWEGRVDSARDDLAAQAAANQSLEREVAGLATANEIRDEYEERADFVRAALENDVDWGLLLNDLSRLIPPRLWVETFSGTVGGTGQGTLGRVSFSGVGFDFPDVSAWLRSLDSEQFRGVTGTWVSTVAQGRIGQSEIVHFTSTASLTPGVATGRADRLIPEVP